MHVRVCRSEVELCSIGLGSLDVYVTRSCEDNWRAVACGAPSIADVCEGRRVEAGVAATADHADTQFRLRCHGRSLPRLGSAR